MTRPVALRSRQPAAPPLAAVTAGVTARGHRPDVVRVMVAVAVWSLPLLRPAGPGNTGPSDLFLMVAICAIAMLLSVRGLPVRFPYAAPVGLFVFAGALASVAAYASAYISVGGGLITLLQDVFVWVVAIAFASAAQEPALLRTATRAWAISATCWAALMIIGVFGHISVLSGETVRDGTRAAFTMGDPNLAADYFVCSLLVLRAVRYPRQPVLRWLCCAVLVMAIVLTGSNGGVLALAVATVAGFLFRLARHGKLARAALAAAAITLAATFVAAQVSTQSITDKAQASIPLLRDSIGRQAESSGSRSMILSETATLYFTADNPLGIGANGTKQAFQALQYPYVKEAHDDYAAALVERGVLGGIALVALMVMIAVRARRIAAGSLRTAYASLVPRPELLGAAVVAVFLSAAFYQVLHFRHVWVLFGLIAGIDLWGRVPGRAGHGIRGGT